MLELKSLLMILAVTVVGAGATLYIKNEIKALPVVSEPVALVETLVNPNEPATSTEAMPDSEMNTPTNPPAVTPKPPVKPPMGIAPSVVGKLTEVNTGCFSDGVCYAVVGGKKVTLLVGRYQGKLGKIIGADSIGDLENYIGASATVFAGQDDEGNFTILGNESFYLQVSSTSKPVVTGACVVGGCSSQLCVEASDMDGMVTTCEYQTKYSCYQKATCERQPTGKCAWTETAELSMCLKNS
jgi:hypothetical protein